MTNFLYVDSSVLVHLALREISKETRILKIFEKYENIGSSELAVVECQAGISFQCQQEPERMTDAEQNLNRLLSQIDLYSVDTLVLGHARSLVKMYRAQMGLRTLDAIHVSTANLVQKSLGLSDDKLEYLTLDKKQHAVFTAEGFLGILL